MDMGTRKSKLKKKNKWQHFGTEAGLMVDYSVEMMESFIFKYSMSSYVTVINFFFASQFLINTTPTWRQLGVQCLAQSHLASRQSQPGFKPPTFQSPFSLCNALCQTLSRENVTKNKNKGQNKNTCRVQTMRKCWNDGMKSSDVC